VSESDQPSLFDVLMNWLQQLVALLLVSYFIVQGLFHTGDSPLTVILMPIGIAITLFLFWLLVVVLKILEAAFTALKARWRRRQRGW